MRQADEDRSEEAGAENGEQIARTPFDGPFAPPLLLLGMSLWFAYDGWWNRSPGAHRWEWLSRGGAALFLVLAVHFFIRGLRRWSGRG